MKVVSIIENNVLRKTANSNIFEGRSGKVEVLCKFIQAELVLGSKYITIIYEKDFFTSTKNFAR